MTLALELARKAYGRTSPNPMVGALILKDGQIIGRGYHQKAGTAHAEIIALEEAGAEARGATLFVTLEPCCHFGKTPPCTTAIINAGIKKVVIAMLDPNPLMSGKGEQLLNAAGIITQVGVLEDEAKQLNEFFCKYIVFNRPFVTLKVAMTLDGKIASASGDSRWVSCEKSREFVHQLRNTYDAIMVGSGTVLADDPQLNTRINSPNKRDPIRVIIDGDLRLPLDATLVKTCKTQDTIIICSENSDSAKKLALADRGVKIIECAGEAYEIPLDIALGKLAEMGIMSILLEGGAALNASMLHAGLIDKVHWFIAPKIIGGQHAVSPVGGNGIEKMNDAWQLRHVKVESMDDDLLVTAYTGW